jgi:hypothetical protein
MKSTACSPSNLNSSSKSGWILIEESAGLDPQSFDLVQPFLGRAGAPVLTVSLGLVGVGGGGELHVAGSTAQGSALARAAAAASVAPAGGGRQARGRRAVSKSKSKREQKACGVAQRAATPLSCAKR